MTTYRLYQTPLLVLLMLPVACSGSGDDDDTNTVQPKDFTVRLQHVGKAYDFSASGAFTTPVGGTMPAPLGPGGMYEVSFSAPPNGRLSFATMFVPSNDFFYAPSAAGITLFQSGAPRVGDITSELSLWDAGTEIDQEPGLGPDQVQRQGNGNTGAADPMTSVRAAADTFNNLPAVTDVIRASLAHDGTMFTLTIENVSTPTTLTTSDNAMQAVPLSPGVWVVHTADGPLFTSGEDDRGEGLQAIAEDGMPPSLAASLEDRSGLTVPVSPGVWVVHSDADPIFSAGSPDRGEGLEAIAEDGMPGGLADLLTTGSAHAAFNTPEGAAGPGPLLPDGAYEFTVSARPGDRVSFVGMFVPSNDLFYAPSGAGIALYDSGDMPRSGPVTNEVMIWDAGTEVNQAPGLGSNQVMFQAGANTGDDEGGNVRLVDDGFDYPSVDSVLRVTITPAP